MHTGEVSLDSGNGEMSQVVTTQAVISTLAVVMTASIALTGLISGLLASGVLEEKKKKKEKKEWKW